MTKNRGFKIESIRDPRAWHFGGVTGIRGEILQPDMDWTGNLTKYEPQYNSKFDTFACVTFSGLNCVETMFVRKFRHEHNFSDRFTAKLSGTTKTGNYFSAVGDSITKLHGVVLEDTWPWDATMDWDAFYSGIPQDVQIVGKKTFETYKIRYEYVWDDPSSLMEALKYSPVQVGIHAYGQLSGDVYQRTEERGNHAVMLCKAVENDHWVIYDHYERKLKKLAWDTKFWGAVRYDIELLTQNPMPDMKIPNNTLVQLVEGTGGFGLYLEGKLYVDELDKILASFMVRNAGKTDGKTMTMKLEQWDSFPHFNLKNEPVV